MDWQRIKADKKGKWLCVSSRLEPFGEGPSLESGRACGAVSFQDTVCEAGFPSHSLGLLPVQEGWLWLREYITFLFFTPSSHLDPAATPHSTLQGSSAATPEHPSVINPLMEQDEGPGTLPAKQSTSSSRSA